MKCKYCGGDVSLDDHFCQHCGRPVDQALRHQMEMEQYETQFEETRQEALDRISVASGGGFAVGIRLAVIGVLLAALIFMVTSLDPYTVNERREKSAAKKNYDAYVAQMEEYLENRDYMEFGSFCRKHQIEFNDDFKAYRGITTAVTDFTNIYRGLQELAFVTDGKAKNNYYLQELSKYVNSFYEDTGRDYYLNYTNDPEHVKAVIGEMEQEFGILMQRYLGLSEEETGSLKELSKSKRTVLIEQALDRKVSELTGSGLQDAAQTEDTGTGNTTPE